MTTVVLWFVTYLKSRHREDTVNGPTIAELKEGEDWWVKSVQRNSFTEEYRMLSREIVIYKGYFLNDDHTICCRGHQNQSDLPSSVPNKTLIYSYRALVMERHNTVHHNDILETLATVRERYWTTLW